jgi:hypothetical protein
MLTSPTQSLQAASNNPNRSFGSIFHFRLITLNNQPSGIKPSKKGNRVVDQYSWSRSGKVRLAEAAFSVRK